MRVLLDHNVPHGLRTHFPEGSEVYTASHLGWSGYDDDKLLDAAVEEGFDVFVTLDSDLPEQLALGDWKIGVIVLAVHPATPEYLEGAMPLVNDALPETASENRLSIIRGSLGGEGPRRN